MSNKLAVVPSELRQEEQFRRVPRVSTTWRLIHWIQAVSVAGCFATGIYIADPFYTANGGYLMAWNRAIHLYFALILDVSMFLIAYLYFFSRGHRNAEDLRPSMEHLTGFKEAAFNFITFNRRRNFDTSKRDPLLAVMFLFLHLLVLLQLFTGLQLYVEGFSANISSIGSWWPETMHLATNWTLWVFGGNVGVRMTHLVTAWIIAAWAVFHIYYEIWRTVMWKEGDLAIMFGGSKFVRSSEEPDA